MALVNLNMNSKYLGGNTEVTIILPDRPWGDEPERFYRSGRNIRFCGFCTAHLEITPTGSASQTLSSMPPKRIWPSSVHLR